MGSIGELYTRYREPIMYVIMGGLTTVVSWVSYYLLAGLLHLEPNTSNILSWLFAVLFAFVVNKWVVFQSMGRDLRTVSRELLTFFSSRIFTGIVAWILFPILMMIGADQIITQTVGMDAKVITSIVEIVLNWVLSKYLVFRKSNDVSE